VALRVFVGTEPRQYVPQCVLAHSIQKHAQKPVELRFVHQRRRRMGGTRFGFVRFLVPALCDYQGIAIYLDADQIVLSDLHELADSLDEEKAIALVHDVEGTFGGRPVEPRFETSVMVLDCARLRSWDPDHLFDNVVANNRPLEPGQIHYRSFMRLAWMDPECIQRLDPRWNHYNLVRPDTKLVHFSHVRDQPWRRPRHPLASFWTGWLREAIEVGAVRRSDVARAVLRGHLHPRLLRYAWM
jgi:hypothetical protein